MCIVSMIGDYAEDNLRKKWPWINPDTIPPAPPNPANPIFTNSFIYPKYVTKEEFEALKKEVEALKELLKKAVEYDIASKQPDCHMDEKVAFLKLAAKIVGIDLSEVFENVKGK